jgi:hypothetical protein
MASNMHAVARDVILRCEPAWASLEGWIVEEGARGISFKARKSALLRMTSNFFRD